jgi:hypothetical protein
MPPRLFRIFGREFQGHPYLIGFVVIVVGLLLWAIIVPLHNRGVKNIVLHGKRAIEAREIRELSPLLAENFNSSLTGNREDTVEQLREAFKNILSIEIKIKRIRIHIADDRANAVVEFTVAGTIRGGSDYPQMPFRGLSGQEGLTNPLECCRLTFVKEADGRWRVSGAELIAAAASGKTGDLP